MNLLAAQKYKNTDNRTCTNNKFVLVQKLTNGSTNKSEKEVNKRTRDNGAKYAQINKKTEQRRT